MTQKKKKVGRPPKKEEEKLIRLTINLPAETIAYLGKRADFLQAAGTAAIVRMIIMDAIKKEQAFDAGQAFPFKSNQNFESVKPMDEKK
mgnify:CR=1 FL=1